MKKSFSRGTALVAGTAMLLINGVVYAWSIYSSPFVEGFGWSSAKLGVCFTVMLGSFCLGGVIGGAVANWRGVRVSVPAGGVLGFVGYLLCMFLQADRPGALLMILSEFAYAGINLVKIQSRPTKQALGDYMFFVDIEGSTQDLEVQTALNCLRLKLREVKVLGSYPVE